MKRSEIRPAQTVARLCLFMTLSLVIEVCLADEKNSHDAQHLYQAVCTQCHGLLPIERTRDGRSGWEDTVHKMVIVGAELNAEEMEIVIDYLAAKFGPGSGPMTSATLPQDAALASAGGLPGQAIVLPEGEGKAFVQGYCGTCHDLGRIVATRRDRDDWPHYVRNMLRQNDLSIDAAEMHTMVTYLQRHFGN